jgi:hypothetical protein
MSRPKFSGRPFADRFWEQVNKKGALRLPKLGRCWEWTGHVNGEYGYLTRQSDGSGTAKEVGAHRAAWELKYGVTLPSNVLVCHKCDHGLCVRWNHLFLGTYADNNADARRKDRHARGERQYNHKLTDALVQEIRRLHGEGLSYRKIAAKLKVVHASTIGGVVEGAIWRHVKETK